MRGRGNIALMTALLGASAMADSDYVVTAANVPEPSLSSGWSRGHGSRRSNKAHPDFAKKKRRRQIARASRQLNRRRAA